MEKKSFSKQLPRSSIRKKIIHSYNILWKLLAENRISSLVTYTNMEATRRIREKRVQCDGISRYMSAKKRRYFLPLMSSAFGDTPSANWCYSSFIQLEFTRSLILHLVREQRWEFTFQFFLSSNCYNIHSMYIYEKMHLYPWVINYPVKVAMTRRWGPILELWILSTIS